jgi:hypothetical protein
MCACLRRTHVSGVRLCRCLCVCQCGCRCVYRAREFARLTLVCRRAAACCFRLDLIVQASGARDRDQVNYLRVIDAILPLMRA